MWNFELFPGTDKQKNELFAMAICTPTGKTFPGNYTIIPLSKKWVFHAIFQLAFVELYGKKVFSLNRLVLTDEEDAEYRSFETMIATHDSFKKSKVMICFFMLFGNHSSVMSTHCFQENQHRETQLN